MNKFAIPAVIIVLMAVSGLYFLSGVHPQEGQIMCTQEALLCPDGSYVGRSGPDCTFSACKNPAYLEGIFERTDGGFRLITDAPVSGGQGVSFVVPLSLPETVLTSSYENKKVHVYGAFTEGISFAVTRIEKLPGIQGDKTTGTVSVGKTVYINGVRITLNRIVSDNRCPKDVVCIVAGAVKVDVTLQSDTDKESLEVSSDQTSVGFDSYQVSIAEVSPAAISTKVIAPGEYVLTFRIVANAGR